jgi:hypothetical protein
VIQGERGKNGSSATVRRRQQYWVSAVDVSCRRHGVAEVVLHELAGEDAIRFLLQTLGTAEEEVGGRLDGRPHDHVGVPVAIDITRCADRLTEEKGIRIGSAGILLRAVRGAKEEIGRGVP